MPAFPFLILGLWLAWLAYWALSAGNSKPERSAESGLSQLAYSVPLWIAAWLMTGRGVPAPLHVRFLPARPMLAPLGTLVVVAGLGFAIAARRSLGANWSLRVAVKEGHELVTAGPYGLVRHPIYSGILLALAGTAVAFGEWRGIVAVALAAAAFWHKLRLEERAMASTFGDAYAAYRRRVAALIPFIL